MKKALSNTLTVSIHAPREGCDNIYMRLRASEISFNSRTPGGVRRKVPIVGDCEKCFNSRTPGGVRRPFL